jgi:hypothetical protein
MAIAAWKRIEKTPGYQRKKRFFKRLVGKELRLEKLRMLFNGFATTDTGYLPSPKSVGKYRFCEYDDQYDE